MNALDPGPSYQETRLWGKDSYVILLEPRRFAGVYMHCMKVMNLSEADDEGDLQSFSMLISKAS
jgi:hypothetical protein